MAAKIFSGTDNEKLKSITHDNGSEMNDFENLEQALNCDIYFTDPASPWQRGLNENTNGLMRQFFPKGSDFKKFTQKDVAKACRFLNHRPRKSLGYRTPFEVFFNKTPVAIRP